MTHVGGQDAGGILQQLLREKAGKGRKGLAPQDELRAVPFPAVEAMPWVRPQQAQELADLARSLGRPSELAWGTRLAV